MIECVSCGAEYSSRGGIWYHYDNNPSHKPRWWPECPSCNMRFNKLGQHWRQSSCDYPPLSDKQKDIITGCLMGDGTIVYHDTDTQKPTLRVVNSNIDYLCHLSELFGILGSGISTVVTADESAENDRESGWNPGADPDNYSDIYRFSTRGHPNFDEFSEWYKSGEKVFPDDILLTPTTLKHWYVCDGSYSPDRNRSKIGITNEKNNSEKIENYFNEIGIEAYVSGEDIRFNVPGTKDLIRYIGDPLPGFRYKWPDNYCQ